MTANNVHTL